MEMLRGPEANSLCAPPMPLREERRRQGRFYDGAGFLRHTRINRASAEKGQWRPALQKVCARSLWRGVAKCASVAENTDKKTLNRYWKLGGRKPKGWGSQPSPLRRRKINKRVFGAPRRSQREPPVAPD
ncbi:hypothetical protein TRVL_02348 [Trypanosoma vivax]|nr:hypothetical protein TRVL_02348 [Trypanosoma vivax]